MRRLVLTLLPLLLAPLAAGAQATADAEDRLSTELRLTGLAFDNLFQAPEGEPQQDVYGGRAEGRFAWRLAPASEWRLYGRGSYSGYDSDLDPSEAVGLGVAGASGIHGLDLFAEYANDRPSVDVDVFDQADVLRATLDYSLRPVHDLSFSVGGAFETQSYENAIGRDNDFAAVGVAARYRRSRRFSPEIGWSTGTRDVDDPGQSYDQDEWFVRLLMAPTPAVYFALRYRLREREYTVDAPLASNFGRQDDRDQWSLTGSLRASPRLEWLLYYAHESSESTRPGVDFTTQMLEVGLAFHFD